MPPPTTPYVTGALASILSKNLFKGQIPSASTPVANTEIDQLILWVDGIIDGDFSDLGYKVPFQEISGETWPSWQTVYLQIMSAVGAMAMTTGHILLPSPVMRPGRAGGEENVYTTLFRRMQARVQKRGLRFRARYYRGTQAERFISDPQAPRTDFQVEAYDPSRYELLKLYTDRMVSFFGDIRKMNIDTDYVRQLLESGRAGNF